MDMTLNTEKTKVMIIKSKRITYDTFVYDNNILEEVPSYKYIGIYIHHKLNWNYNIEKKINGGWKTYMGSKTIVNEYTFGFGIKINSFHTLVTPILLWVGNISIESWRKIE
jgi:hypothetical protein